MLTVLIRLSFDWRFVRWSLIWPSNVFQGAGAPIRPWSHLPVSRQGALALLPSHPRPMDRSHPRVSRAPSAVCLPHRPQGTVGPCPCPAVPGEEARGWQPPTRVAPRSLSPTPAQVWGAPWPWSSSPSGATQTQGGTPYPWQEPHILTLLSAPQNDLAKPEETLLGYFYQIDRLVSASIPLNNKELITLWCGMLNPWGILIENEVTLSWELVLRDCCPQPLVPPSGTVQTTQHTSSAKQLPRSEKLLSSSVYSSYNILISFSFSKYILVSRPLSTLAKYLWTHSCEDHLRDT